ncbi:MAG: SelB C-terminal domain-containing protein, partial [Deltaproteobacteria bacterium]|nr:SelB C-terminal domain-containing protein [Deltaproteobacteria bacterium]
VTREGIEALKEEIRKQTPSILAQARANQNLRIPIDRVFSLSGFGTVVTGPLLFGSVSLEEEVEIFPIGKRAFVRRLHAYGKEISSLQAPSRVALNLRGISREELKRGNMIGTPHAFKPITKATAQVKFLKENHTLSECIFHSGTTKTTVWIKKDPKSEKYFLKFLDPLILQPGDPFILRTHTTLGGGKVLNIALEQVKLKQLSQEPSKEKIAIQAQEMLKYCYTFWNESLQPLEIESLRPKLKYTAEEFHLVLRYLVDQKKVIRLPKGLYLPYERYEGLKEKMNQFFKTHSELQVTDVKTLFGLSRKHAIPYLEFFDQEKWTLRKGDVRLPWQLTQT